MAKIKLFPKKNKQSLSLRDKNLLPLLAVTVLVLSFALVNYSEFKSSTVINSQDVLSETDEKSEDKKEEKETERKEVKNEVKREVAKQETNSGRIEIEKDTEDENEVEDVSETETETEFEQESETASSDGTVNKFKLKIKTRTVAGKTIIETAAGEMEVENSPDEAINDLVSNEILDTPTSFEAKTNDNKRIEFEVQGLEVKKLLGLFTINLPKSVTIDAETGEIVSSSQNIWTQFLSLLSI